MWKVCCVFVGIYFISKPASSQTETLNSIFCEFSKSTVECSSSIRVLLAIYGRTQEEIRECPPGNVRTSNCSKDVTTELSELCDGKQKCGIEVAIRLYGDPCPNVLKYLNFTYICTAQLPPITTEKLMTTSEINPSTSRVVTTISSSSMTEIKTTDENLSTTEGLRTTTVEQNNGSDESMTTTTTEPTDTESNQSVIIGTIVGVASVFALTAIVTNIILFRKKRCFCRSRQDANNKEDHVRQTEDVEATDATTHEYMDTSGSFYCHKYQDLTAANNVKQKIDDSDGYLDERGLYGLERFTGVTFKTPTTTDHVYDYIN